MAFISDMNDGSLASSGFTVLRALHGAPVAQEFVFAFLRTHAARSQLVRRNRGSMYPAVLDNDVRDVFVPFPDKTLELAVIDSIRTGLDLQRAFFAHFEKQQLAVTSLLAAIGRPPPDPLTAPPTGISSSIRHSSEFFAAGGPLRFDAEFFRAEYDAFEQLIGSVSGSFRVGTYYSASNGRALGPEKEDVPYVKQGALTNVGINWSAVEPEPGSTMPERGRVRNGDVLLACTAHEIYYVGRRVDYVREVPQDLTAINVAVPDLMILRPRENTPATLDGAYLAAFLRSPWGLHQVQRLIRGLRGGHVYPRDVEQFVRVPMPSPVWLNEFAVLAATMESTRNAAKAKISEAVLSVESWLAKGVGTQPS